MQLLIINNKVIATHNDDQFVDGLYGVDATVLHVPPDVVIPPEPESGQLDVSDIAMTPEQEAFSLVMKKAKDNEVDEQNAKLDKAVDDLKKDGGLPADYVLPDKYKKVKKE